MTVSKGSAIARPHFLGPMTEGRWSEELESIVIFHSMEISDIETAIINADASTKKTGHRWR